MKEKIEKIFNWNEMSFQYLYKIYPAPQYYIERRKAFAFFPAQGEGYTDKNVMLSQREYDFDLLMIFYKEDQKNEKRKEILKKIEILEYELKHISKPDEWIRFLSNPPKDFNIIVKSEVVIEEDLPDQKGKAYDMIEIYLDHKTTNTKITRHNYQKFLEDKKWKEK